MLQLRVNGTGFYDDFVYIDLYETDPIKLNLSLESLETFAPQSTFTRSFRVPATTNNYKFFNSVFSINGYDFDVTVKHPATLLVGTNEYKNGHLRLVKIYHSNDERHIDYEVVFYGETRDFSSITGNLNEIDLSDYNHTLNFANITSSWQAYPENGIPGLNDGLLNGDVVYPLVNFGNTYNSSGTPLEPEVRFDGTKPITSATNSLDITTRLKPIVRAKVIWDKIFEEAGYTYESNFLDSNLFRHLYVTAWGNDESITIDASQNLMKADSNYIEIDYDLTPYYNFQTEVYDYGNNFNGNFYTIPADGTYQYKFVIQGDFLSSTSAGGTVTFNVYKKENVPGGVTTLLYNDSVTGLAGQEGYFTFNTGVVSESFYLTDNEILYCELLIDGNVLKYSPGGIFEIVKAPGEMDLQFYMDNQYKKLDFIKDIISKFKLVLAPHPSINYRFIIEPWSEYIGTGEVKDWSNKLDRSKDIVVEPLFYEQKEEIDFKDKLGGDYLNKLNNDSFEEVYGTLKVDTQNELLKGKKDITTNLVPVPPTQIEGATSSTNGGINTIVPQIHSREAKEGFIEYKPIRSSTRLVFYDGLINTGHVAGNNKTWWYNAGGSDFSRTDYPMISVFSEWPVDTQTLNLSWQKETGYIRSAELVGYDVNIGESVYDRYWSSYIDLIYNKWSRRLTAYFYLTSEDITNFSFDNVIFFKGNYFYVEKISDALLNDNSPTKVSLIKLNNYQPDPSGFTPPGNVWNEFNEVWNLTTATWDD